MIFFKELQGLWRGKVVRKPNKNSFLLGANGFEIYASPGTTLIWIIQAEQNILKSYYNLVIYIEASKYVVNKVLVIVVVICVPICNYL